MKVQEEDVMKD